MIKKFEMGHWYRFTGKERLPCWNKNGEMDFVLDNSPRKCVCANGTEAVFESDSVWMWNWEVGLNLWEEVNISDEVKQSIKEILN